MEAKREKRIYHLDDGTSVSISKLRKLRKEKQIEVMRGWFSQHYSDPVILPYDSSEGGFQWIWNGPFEAKEELSEEFSGVVKDSALYELAHELTEQNWQWSGNPDSSPTDEVLEGGLPANS